MIRTDMNETENRKTIEKINEAKSWLFEKINKIDKLLAKLTLKKRIHKLPISRMKPGPSLKSCISLKDNRGIPQTALHR